MSNRLLRGLPFGDLGLNLGFYLYRAGQIGLFVLLPALIVAAIGYARSSGQPTMYRATATLYVEQAPGLGVTSSTAPDVYTSAQLAAVYSQMIVSPTLAGLVDAEMARRFPGFRLENDSVSSTQQSGVQSSQLFYVSVTDLLPDRAIAATNAVAHAFIKRITQIESARFSADERSLQIQVNGALAQVQAVQKQIDGYTGSAAGLRTLNAALAADQGTYRGLEASLSTFQAARDAVVSNVSVYAPAAAAAPSSASPRRSALIYGFFALLLFGGLVYLYERLNDLIRSPEEAEELAGAPVLGTVQAYDPPAGGDGLIVVERPRSPVAESYRLIRANLQYADIDHPARTLLVTSALPREGKSTTVANLARVFAEAGMNVRLIDADLRRPSLHRAFGVTGRGEGLTNLLAAGELNGHGLQATAHDRLELIASGPLPPSPADLLQSARMRTVVGHLQEGADIVLIDSPPVLAVADAPIISSMVDGVVLVIDPQTTKRQEIVQMRDAIDAVGGRILGIILNRVRSRGRLYYQHYGAYGYKSGYKYVYGDEPVAGSSSSAESAPGARRT